MNRHIWLSAFGKTQRLMEWSLETDIPYDRLLQRLQKTSLTIEEALTLPPQTRVPCMLTAFGHTKRKSEWARDYSIDIVTLSWRLKSGWTAEDALQKPVRPRKE